MPSNYVNYKCFKDVQVRNFGTYTNPDSKVHGANMGPTWGRQDPGGPHVGRMNLAIWERFSVVPTAKNPSAWYIYASP